jgi:microcompartment protein CcmL/EutN
MLCRSFRIMSRPALGLIETAGSDGAIGATRAASETGEVVIVSAERGRADGMVVKIEGDWSAVQAALEAGARAADKAGQLVSLHMIPKSTDDVSRLLPYRKFMERFRGSPERVEPKKPRGSGAPARKEPKALPTKEPAARSQPKARPVATQEARAIAAKQSDRKTPAADSPPPATQEARASADKPPESPGAPGWSELQNMPVVKLRKYARSIPEMPIKGREISKANKQQLLDALASIGKDKE